MYAVCMLQKARSLLYRILQAFIVLVLVPRTRPRKSDVHKVRIEIFSRTRDEHEDEDEANKTSSRAKL